MLNVLRFVINCHPGLDPGAIYMGSVGDGSRIKSGMTGGVRDDKGKGDGTRIESEVTGGWVSIYWRKLCGSGIIW